MTVKFVTGSLCCDKDNTQQVETNRLYFSKARYATFIAASNSPGHYFYPK